MTTNHFADAGNMVFGDTLQSRAYRAFNALSDLGWSICNCTGDLPHETRAEGRWLVKRPEERGKSEGKFCTHEGLIALAEAAKSRGGEGVSQSWIEQNPSAPEDERISALATYLVGMSLDPSENALVWFGLPGEWTVSHMTKDQRILFDSIATRCAKCDWWCDADELDEAGMCNDCRAEKVPE